MSNEQLAMSNSLRSQMSFASVTSRLLRINELAYCATDFLFRAAPVEWNQHTWHRHCLRIDKIGETSQRQSWIRLRIFLSIALFPMRVGYCSWNAENADASQRTQSVGGVCHLRRYAAMTRRPAAWFLSSLFLLKARPRNRGIVAKRRRCHIPWTSAHSARSLRTLRSK